MLHGDGDRKRGPELRLGTVDADQARLQVQRVLGGLEEEQVAAALDQAEGLGAVVLGEVVPGDAAGHRDGLGGGAHRAGDEARPVGGRVLRRRRARDAGRRDVDRVVLGLEPVLGQHQRRRPEGVGLEDVGAGGEKALVDALDDVWTGQDEILVAALEVGTAEVLGAEIEGLDRRPHGAVEHEDALGEESLEKRRALCAVVGHGCGPVHGEASPSARGPYLLWARRRLFNRALSG